MVLILPFLRLRPRIARLSAWIFVALSLARYPATAAPATLTPVEVEAVFLFNFAQFVAWPATSFQEPRAPMVIGILGKDPFGSILDDVVNGEKVNGHPIVIRRFAQVQEIDRCHILFIAGSENDRLTQVCTSLRNRPILTVSDIKDFARRGGMIEFVEDRERIRFRIALQRARSESLEISAKLLRPAEVVFHFPRNREVVMQNFPPAEPGAPGFVSSFLAPTLLELMHRSFDQNHSTPLLLR